MLHVLFCGARLTCQYNSCSSPRTVVFPGATGKCLSDDPEYQPRIGLFSTAFNLSQSFPQLFVSFGAPFIMAHFDNDVSSVMFVGGILALVGFALIFVLRVDIFEGDDYMSAGSGSGSSVGDHVPIADVRDVQPPVVSVVRSIPTYDGSDREPFLSSTLKGQQ
jgi:hypothetical protein